MTGQRDLSVQALGLDLSLGENSGCGPWEQGRIMQLWQWVR